MLLYNCNSRGLGLFLLYFLTWPIKEMPLNNTIGYCLASPHINWVLGLDLGELLYNVETIMRAVP